MKTSRFLLSALFLMLLSSIHSQVDLKPDHFFIYDLSTDTKKEFEFGKYGANASKLVKKDYFKTFDELQQTISSQKYHGVLVYIHGLWADSKHFEESTGKFLHDTIFGDLNGRYDLILSLKWSSGLQYEKNVQTASKKGQSYFSYLDTIFQTLRANGNEDMRITFVVHSMGNRVLEGIQTKKVEHNKKWNIDLIYMFAPDLESNVFFDKLNQLPNDAQKIYVYHNIDDRTLAMANVFKSHKRLGIYGHDDATRLPQNVKIIDTTGLLDNEGVMGRFTLHRYYYSSPSIRAQIKTGLMGL